MEMVLKQDMYTDHRIVWSGTISKEFSADCVVPDTMPDVGAVIDGDGTLVLRSRETSDGRIAVEAVVNAAVLYTPEDGGAVRSLAVSVPAEFTMDAPEVDGDCRSVVRLRIRALDARMVNSRKVSLRADVEAEATCFGKSSLVVASGVGEGQVPSHLRTNTVTVVQVCDIREKTFVITDGYALPAGISGGDGILLQRVEVFPQEARFVSGKVVFRGCVKASLLFGDKDGHKLVSSTYETEFSQIMEVDGEEDAVPEIRLALTGVYFDFDSSPADGGKLMAEIHMAAQCVCRQRRELTYISDLYSNSVHLVPSEETISICSYIQPVTMRQTVAGKMDAIAGEGDIVSVSCSVGAISVAEGSVKTAVNIRLLIRRSDGQLALSRSRQNVEFTPDLPADGELISVAVRCGESYCSPGAAGTDVRTTLQMDGICVRKEDLTCVSRVEADEEDVRPEGDYPSVTLVRVSHGTDIWSLAKKYHSTVEAIQRANEGEEDGLLLIPKTR